MAQGVDSTGGGTAGRGHRCRFCDQSLDRLFIDLGMSPLCESYVAADSLDQMEPFYPLRVFVCERCWLVQLEEHVSPDRIFSEYAYFSSYSSSWVEHARQYVDAITTKLRLNSASSVVEVASNDGYLLQHFVARGIPVIGVEPAANVAGAAVEKGIPTHVGFFGVATASTLASEPGRADLIVANNVLAHVADLNGFVEGLHILLKPSGSITLEFPHLVQLMKGNQFDTIYHEHFSYLSLALVRELLQAHGLRPYDVEEISTHGGSLRVYCCHETSEVPEHPTVENLIEREARYGLHAVCTYERFAERVIQTKQKLLEFLIAARRAQKVVVGYGAPGGDVPCAVETQRRLGSRLRDHL